MKPTTFCFAFLVGAASVVGAQGPGKTAASKPPAAKTSSAPAQKPAQKPAAAAARKPTAAPTRKPAATPRSRLHVPAGDTVVTPVIMREVFTYVANGRRDPFFSLLNTDELRPAISDLTLAGILQDNSGKGRSVAILKDAQSNQYRVRVGSTLGRMRVAAIHRNAVVFLIEEFGASREDSLVLSDSTTGRSR